jgi:hypothetical protein
MKQTEIHGATKRETHKARKRERDMKLLSKGSSEYKEDMRHET